MMTRGVAIAVVLALSVAMAGCKESQKLTQDGPTTPSATTSTSTSTTPATATGTGPAPKDAVPSPVSSRTDVDAAKTDSGIRVIIATQDTDALSLARTERLRAKAEGRVLVVYAGAGWCEPCKRFKNAVQTGALDDKLAKTTLLVFDADRDADRLSSAGYTFKFIPYVGLPGSDGHPTDSAEARSKGSEAWRDLIAKLQTWQANGPSL